MFTQCQAIERAAASSHIASLQCNLILALCRTSLGARSIMWLCWVCVHVTLCVDDFPMTHWDRLRGSEAAAQGTSGSGLL